MLSTGQLFVIKIYSEASSKDELYGQLDKNSIGISNKHRQN